MVKYETTADILSWLDNDKLMVRIERNERALERKERQIEHAQKAKERVQQEKERVQQEKERLRERSVMGFLSKAISKEAIAAILEITIEDINSIEKKYQHNNPFTMSLNGESTN